MPTQIMELRVPPKMGKLFSIIVPQTEDVPDQGGIWSYSGVLSKICDNKRIEVEQGGRKRQHQGPF